MWPNSSNQKAFKLLALTLALSTVVKVSYAQGLESEDAVLNVDPIATTTTTTTTMNGNMVNTTPLDVNGNYQVPSEADAINRRTQELARKTNEMVQKNVAVKRDANEKKLANELTQMFNGQPVAQEVTTQQASVQKVEVTAAEVKPEEKVKNYKVIPYGGAQQMQGSGEVNFQAKVNTGVRAEALVADQRVGIGLGFNYAQTDIRDNRYVNYYGMNQNAPEFKYRNMTGEIYGKFFLLNKSVFRPYAGAGLAYNTSKLTHTSQQNNYYSTNYGNNNSLNQGYDSSYASAAAMIGTDFNFTDSVGLNLEFKYSRALTSAFNSNNIGVQQGFLGYDQAYLQQLGQQMNEAALMAVNFGLVIRF